MQTSTFDESLLSAKCPHWTTFFSLTANVVYGQPLIKIIW